MEPCAWSNKILISDRIGTQSNPGKKSRIQANLLGRSGSAVSPDGCGERERRVVRRASGAMWRWLLPLVAATVAQGRAVRFGDRLAPRLPPALPPFAPPAPPDAPDEYEVTASVEEAPAPIAASPEPEPPEAPRHPSRTEAHRLEMSTEFFVVPERAMPSQATSSRAPPAEPPRAPPDAVRTESWRALRSEPWAVPVLALAAVSMLAVAAFEAFVLYYARRTTPSRRHLFLGQTLLFGLFLCAATAALLAATPTPLTCAAVRFGAGVAYAVVFASLLVKCVFLLSLNGGVYLPATYQALLLFFAVLIQVAIGAQWVGGAPARVLPGPPPLCRAPVGDTLLSLAYVACLLALVGGVALRSRAVRDNYREAQHIAAAAGASGLVALCWTAAALATAERHRDACLAAGLLATAAAVFLLMFATKGRRLAAAGKEGRYEDDRDDGLSSLGRAASGYSPSFFHFKPVKYGIVTAQSGTPPAPPPLENKDASPQPSDRYAAMGFTSPPHYYSHPYYSPHFFYPSKSNPFQHYQYSPYHCFMPPPGILLRSDDGNVYTTLEPTFSSNPNVYFHRTEGHGGVHPGMMY